MLSARDLTAMRAECALVLDQTATIQRNTPVSDGRGGFTESWGTAGTVACHVLPRQGQTTLEGDRPVSVTLWEILLPVGTNVTARDRLVIGGETYEISDLDTGGSYPIQLVANARKVV